MPAPNYWLTDADKARHKNYHENTLLYKGEYVRVWRDLEPIDKSFKPIIVNDAKLITGAIANLLFREPPAYLAENQDASSQAALDRIVKQTRFNALNKRQATWASVLGDLVYLVRWNDTTERVSIDYVHPKHFYGVFNPLDTSELEAAILAYPIYHRDGIYSDKVAYVYRQVHLPGLVRNELWEANDEALTRQVSLADVPQFAELPAEVETGIDELLVVHARNLECPGEPYGLSDYTSAQKSKFHAVSERYTQLNMVLAKHADPKLVFPQSVLDSLRDENSGQVVIHKDQLDMIGLQLGEQAPSYLTWDGQLEAGFKAVKELRTAILEEGQISPALIGRTSDGINGGETGRASIMKLLASLGFADSKQQLLEPALQKVLRVAQKLENSRFAKSDQYEVSEVQVVWQDGLPADTREMVETEATLAREMLTSRFSAIKRLTGGTDAQVEQEMERIDEEQESNLPPFSPLLPATDEETPEE